MRVSFLIAGTQRGGTTALHTFLSAHPQIVFARRKEVHFFDDESLFRGGPAPDLYARYHGEFPPADEAAVIGEATPIYMYWKRAARRIRDYNPAMKLVVVLRNPIERAYSHYTLERNRHREPLSFSRAIRLERLRCLRAWPLQHRVFSYVDRGFYSRQIRRLLDHFPRKQMLFIKSDDLRQDHAATLARICRFLDVAPLPDSKPEAIFQSRYASPMSPADRAYLARKFRPEISALERLLGWDCSSWKEPPA
jgi:hypothetical protein